MEEVDGGDAEWTVEPDAVRGGARSVHITLTRCKSTGYIPWPRPFRNQKEVGDLPLFRKPVFGDGLAPPALDTDISFNKFELPAASSPTARPEDAGSPLLSHVAAVAALRGGNSGSTVELSQSPKAVSLSSEL